MIELHREDNDEIFSGRIEEKLDEMVVAYKVHRYSAKDTAKYKLPYLREGRTVITGTEKIRKYLDELNRELKLQRSITSDACYIDPETGEVC